MRRVSFGAKIFLAIVTVSVVTSATAGAILYWNGSRLLRLKSTDELTTAAAAVSHFLEHSLEDALRQGETCTMAWETGEDARVILNQAQQQAFLEHARYFVQNFPWVTAVALREDSGRILLSHGDGRSLSESLDDCDPIALLPKGCFARGPVLAEGGTVLMELGVRRFDRRRPCPCLVTFVLNVSALMTAAPVPKTLFQETVVMLGRPGRAEGILIKGAPWADQAALEDLSSWIGQVFLSGRRENPGPVDVGGRKVLVAADVLPRLRWPVALAVPVKSARIPQSALLAAAAWAFLLGLVGDTWLEVAVRSYYANQDTRTPLIAAALQAAGFIALASLLSSTRLGVAGIALAASLTFTLQAIGLLFLLQRRYPGLLRLGTSVRNAALAAMAAFLVATGILLWLGVSPLHVLLAWLVGGCLALPFIRREVHSLLHL